MTIYEVITDTALPPYAPLTGWRRWLARLGLPAPRQVLWGINKNNKILCHPKVLDRVMKHLDAEGVVYVVSTRPQLVKS